MTDEQTNVELRARIRGLRKSLEKILRIAEHGFPKPSHEGSCGPWAQCDGDCEAHAYCVEDMCEARRLLAVTEAEATPEAGLSVDRIFPRPWSVDVCPQETPPARRSARIYAADSTHVCETRGEIAASLAQMIVEAVNQKPNHQQT